MATAVEYRSLTDEGMLQRGGRGRGKKHSLGISHSMGPVTTTTSGKSKGRPRRRKHDRENTKQKVKHSVIDWLRNNYMLVEEGSFAKLRLFYEYQEMCKEQGIKPTTNSAFGKLVHCAFPGVQCNRKGPRGNAKHHYKNLAPRPNGSTGGADSKPRSKSSFDDDEYDDDSEEVVEEEVVEEDSEEESEVDDSSDSSSEEDGGDLDSSSEASESRPGSVVGNPLNVVSPVMSSPVMMTTNLPAGQQLQQPQPQGQLQFVPLSQVSYTPINDASALYVTPAATTEYLGMPTVGSTQPTLVVPRALHSAVTAHNPYAPMVAHASRPQPMYSAGYPAGYFQPVQAAPTGPVPVLATTNSPFVPFNPSLPVMTPQPNTAAVADYTISSPELCPAAMEVPLMNELNFGGWESVDASLVDECEGVPGANYFKPLVNTESYALLRFRQQQRRRKQRRSQFLFQQLEQMQEEKQKADRECISPSADVDHSVALDDDFWDWVSEFVSKDKQDGDSASSPDSDSSAASSVAIDTSTIPNEWETDFGTANDLEKFLNNP